MREPAAYNLSTQHVADQLGVSQDTVQRWADEGRIACVRTPGRWRRFRQQDVDNFAASFFTDEGSAA